MTIDELKEKVKALGWTQADLAKKAEIDPAHLGRVMSGKRPLTRLMAGHLERVIDQCVSSD